MITYRPEYIECLYASMTTANLNTLKAALSWLVMLRRTPVTNQISMSWGGWERDIFGLLPLVPANWSRSCWTKMFDTGIVASLLDLGDCDGCDDDDDDDDDDFDESEFLNGLSQLLPERPLLKTGPDVMSLLAGVTRPVQVEGGYILCGRYSAVVPVVRQADGSVLWHYEMKEAQGPELRVDDLESLRGEWYQTFDLDLLINAPALIGWSREGELLIGTDKHTHNTTWAPKESQPLLHFRGNLSITNAAVNRLPTSTNYYFMLHRSHHYSWILYDVPAKRAWLVPESSLLLYMVSIYCKDFGGKKFPPPNTPAGGQNARDYLLRNAELVIWEQRTLGDLVTSFATTLGQIAPRYVTGGRIAGYQLMDLVHGAGQMSPETIHPRPSANWTALLRDRSCLLGANMGELITGTRSTAANSPCNHLPIGQNLLAATVQTLNDIKEYRYLPTNSCAFQYVPGGVWMTSSEAFTTCDHDKNSKNDCWQNPNLPQTIVKEPKKKKTNAAQDAQAQEQEQEIPEDGVVVFGKITDRFLLFDLARRSGVAPWWDFSLTWFYCGREDGPIYHAPCSM